MNLTINIWFLDDVCRKAGGIRCNGRDKCSDILRMMNFPHNSRYIQILYKYVGKIKFRDCLHVERCFGHLCVFWQDCRPIKQTFWPIKLISGGMALQGNSWSCSCENVWLGRWLRRWMREALQLHTSVVERGQTIRNGLNILMTFPPRFSFFFFHPSWI